MTLRVLPPGDGGGGGNEPPDGPTMSPAEVQAALTAKLFALAELMTITQRRFAEALVRDQDPHAAIIEAVPKLAKATSATVARHINAMIINPLVAEYVQAALGIGAISTALSYRAVLIQMWLESSDPSNPGYVRVAAAAKVLDELRASGIAALEGLQAPDPLGKGDDRQPGALSDDDLEELEGILFGEEAG